jgi:hypothetical protein
VAQPHTDSENFQPLQQSVQISETETHSISFCRLERQPTHTLAIFLQCMQIFFKEKILLISQGENLLISGVMSQEYAPQYQEI